MSNKHIQKLLPIFTPNEMYQLDSYIINNVMIPSMLLMEAAAIYSAKFIKAKLDYSSCVLILCGVGNNGGDGLALVRHLSNIYKVDYSIIGDNNKFSTDAQDNYNILKSLNINETPINQIDWEQYDCIIDSILGIGSNLPLRENISQVINLSNQSNALKIAIDIPTGLDAYTGIADKTTFKADYTLTMYGAKTGLYLNDGKDYSGKVVKLDLGIPNNILDKFSNVYQYKTLKHIIRKNNTSKYDYSRCLVIAGSETMKGAGILASNAAISAGAGLVYFCSTNIGSGIYSEIMTLEISDYNDNILNNQEISPIFNKCNSLIIGPGLGKSKSVKSMINAILNKYPGKQVILDADGISALDSNKSYNHNITITPHLGEFSTLLNLDKSKIVKILPDIVKETAKKMNINILLKGPTTIISDGEEVIFVTSGVPQMATAGSGDVLSGILGSQLPLNICDNPIQNIANAALLHIEATKYVLKTKTNIIASDIIKGIQCVR